MSTNQNKSIKFLDKLKVPYRVQIIDENTLKKRNVFKITGLHLAGIILIFFLVSIVFFTSLMAIPPVRRAIVGENNIVNSSAFIKLNRQVLELEKAILDQSVYITGLRNMLTGDMQSVLKANPSKLDLNSEDFGNNQNHDHNVHDYGHDHAHDHSSKPPLVDNKKLKTKLNHLIPPLKGRISAHFEKSLDHLGVDIIAAKDTPILSIADGVVIHADWTLETGNTISIQHDDEILSVYAHNSTLLKQPGEYVSAGEAIAIIGNSGEQTSGPHLHFELWIDGTPMNPIQFIPF